MIVTHEQKKWLQGYLRSVLDYRETYQEVYDHILLALENRPPDKFFETSVNAIIEDDLGGRNGLMKLEENCQTGVARETSKQYRGLFTKWLGSLSAIYTILFIAGIYYISGHIKYGLLYVLAVCLFMILVPVCLLAIRSVKSHYGPGDIKASAKDNIFRRIAYFPFRILLNLIVFQTAFNFILYRIFLFHQIHPDDRTYGALIRVNFQLFFIGAFILATIHLISFYKIYKNGSRINLISPL